MQNKNIITRLDNWSYGVLFVGIILSCFAFIPFFPLSLEIVKGYFFTVGVASSFVLFIIARMYEGSVNILRTKIIISAGLLTLLVVLASIFSSSPVISFWGRGFEVDTAAFFITGFLALILSSHHFVNKDRLVGLLTTLLSINILLSLLTLARVFFPGILTMGVLGDKTSVLMGTWNDSMIFFAFTALIAISVIDLVKVKKGLLKIVAYLSLVLSIVMLVVGNFLLAWTLFGAILLVLFVYTVTVENGSSSLNTRSIPVTSLIVIIISIFFIAGHSNIGEALPKLLSVQYTELRPSTSATYSVAVDTIEESPIFGVGPNQFAVAWAKFKPEQILSTNFWNTNFSSGSSVVFSSAVTIGLLGFIGWLLFVFVTIFSVYKSFLIKPEDKVQANLKTITIILALYLILVQLFYTAGSVTSILFWVFVGIMATIIVDGNEKYLTVSLVGNPKKNFIQLSFVLLILILTIIFTFSRTEQFLGRVSLVGASKLYSNDGDPVKVEALLLKSNNLSPRDDTYRASAQFYSSLLGKELALLQDESNLTDEESAKLKAIWNSAELSAVLAAKLEPGRVENWQFLGNFYLEAAAIGIQGSLDNAELAYKNSLTVSPNDPGVYVSLAEIAYRKSDINSGDAYIDKALELSPAFSSALTLKDQINQIQSSQQDISSAEITVNSDIESVE